jgi:hypothetical protein
VGDAAGLAAGVADDAVLPVDVLGTQSGYVGLGATEIPEELVKGVPLRVGFASEDSLVLVPSDGAPGFEFDRRPAFLGQHGPRDPVHVQREAVDTAQVGIDGYAGGFEYAQEMFAAGFEQDQVAD